MALPLLLLSGGPGLLSLCALLALVALLVWALYVRTDYVMPIRAHMTFFQHAREFAARLKRVLALYVFWTAAFLMLRFEATTWRGFRFAAPVFDMFHNTAAGVYHAIAQDQLPDGVRVLVTTPTGGVAAHLQIALLLASLLTMPALLFEVWAFFGPGLQARERRALARALPAALALFLAGAAFAYVFIVPFMLRTLYAFAAPLDAATFVEADALVGTVTTFCALFGLAFQLPLVLVMLVRLGAVEPESYLRKWRHVTVGIFIVAAVVTDPTLVSQLLVAAVLLVLYWGGVAISYMARPSTAPALRKAAAAP